MLEQGGFSDLGHCGHLNFGWADHECTSYNFIKREFDTLYSIIIAWKENVPSQLNQFSDMLSSRMTNYENEVAENRPKVKTILYT